MRAWAVRFEPRGLERDEAGLGFIEVAWVCLAFRTHVVDGLGCRAWLCGRGAFLSGAWRVNEGHLVDALALRGDEGRGTLRKAWGRCEQPLIPRSPNGETPAVRQILI